MNKKYLFPIIIIFTLFFCSLACRKTLYFKGGTEEIFANVEIEVTNDNQLKVKCIDNKDIEMNIWIDEGEAAMYFMGNHMFEMSAKYLPIKGSTQDNLIELQGNGFRKIHLNKSRKILYFREGATGIFANVEIEVTNDNQLKVRCINNNDIRMNIWMDKGRAVMYFMGNYMFRMSAHYFPIKGAPRDNLIELQGNAFGKIYLNKSRKILLFRRE